MTRLRVLKRLIEYSFNLLLPGFIHYDPFEGTETLLRALVHHLAIGFIHYDPFEGTET